MRDNNQVQTSWLPVLLRMLIVIMLFVLAMMYCNYQRIFTVMQIEVTGNYELDNKEIVRISGIKRGQKMFDLDLSGATAKLIEEPYIFNAYVSRQFPDKVNIHIIERHPMVLIDLKERYAIDAFATVLPLPRRYDTRTLPVIQGIDPSLAMEIGKTTLHPDIRRIISFVNYIRTYQDGTEKYCNHISWSEDKGWIIRQGAEYPAVYLGNSELKKRIDILHAFVQEMESRSIDMRKYRYISLRFHGQLIVRDKL
jgi:cell division protein FtsQ